MRWSTGGGATLDGCQRAMAANLRNKMARSRGGESGESNAQQEKTKTHVKACTRDGQPTTRPQCAS
jgi:hypothetical protein